MRYYNIGYTVKGFTSTSTVAGGSGDIAIEHLIKNVLQLKQEDVHITSLEEVSITSLDLAF